MKASRADSISAGLGLVWLIAAAAFVLILVQHAPQPAHGLAIMGGRLDFAHALEDAAAAPQAQLATELEQRALAEFIAKRWRIAEPAAARFVATAYKAGREHSVDPVLILSVIAVESRFNPVAESVMGAMGLMQVIPRFHMEKLAMHGGDEQALLDPEVNIRVGAQILREYYRRLGDQEAALQMYAGAFDEPSSQYAGKVFAEQARLEPVRKRARKQQTAQSA